jgi:hypothetical protein
MSRRPLRTHGRLVAVGLSLLLLLGATGGSGTSSGGDQHCLNHRSSEFQKFSDSVEADLATLGVTDFGAYVPPAGTEFCVKAGTSNTGQVTADGTTSLRGYLDAATITAAAGYYLVYVANPPAYELTWDRQPAYAELAPGTVYADGDRAPRVLVKDAVSKASVSGAYIEVELSPNPLALGGTVEVQSDSSGFATFGDLQISTLGQAFRLVASSPFAAENTTSAAFDVYNEAEQLTCTNTSDTGTSDCPGTFTPPDDDPYSFGLDGTISGGGTGTFTVGFGVVSSEKCTSEPAKAKISRIPGAFTIAGVGFDSKTLVLTIDGAWDKETYPSVGVSQYQICAEPAPPATASSLFNDRYSGKLVVGTITHDVKGNAVSGEKVGFLPDCSKTVGAPCVASRIKVDGSPLITIRWGSKIGLR